jgi:hypothetical protein
MAPTNPTSSLDVQNWFETTLSAQVGSTDTTINLNAVPTPSEGYLILDPDNTSLREVIHYTSTASGSVSLPGVGDRGVDSTSAQPHAQNAIVRMEYTTSHYDALKNGYGLSNNSITYRTLAPGVTRLAFNDTPINAVLGTAATTTAIASGTSHGGVCEVYAGFIAGNANSGVYVNVIAQVLCDGAAIVPTIVTLNAPFISGATPLYTYNYFFQSTPSAATHTWALSLKATAGSAVQLADSYIKVEEVA